MVMWAVALMAPYLTPPNSKLIQYDKAGGKMKTQTHYDTAPKNRPRSQGGELSSSNHSTRHYREGSSGSRGSRSYSHGSGSYSYSDGSSSGGRSRHSKKSHRKHKH